MKKILERLKSPVVLLGLLAIVISVSGISPENMTEWSILIDNIVGIFKNPFVLLSIIGSVFAFLNNPTDKEHF
jgi:hypothetical protein